MITKENFDDFLTLPLYEKIQSLTTGPLFLKAENKVPSSKNSISPPIGKPCASFEIFTFVSFKLS